jgi:hypothetical protein
MPVERVQPVELGQECRGHRRWSLGTDEPHGVAHGHGQVAVGTPARAARRLGDRGHEPAVAHAPDLLPSGTTLGVPTQHERGAVADNGELVEGHIQVVGPEAPQPVRDAVPHQLGGGALAPARDPGRGGVDHAAVGVPGERAQLRVVEQDLLVPAGKLVGDGQPAGRARPVPGEQQPGPVRRPGRWTERRRAGHEVQQVAGRADDGQRGEPLSNVRPAGERHIGKCSVRRDPGEGGHADHAAGRQRARRVRRPGRDEPGRLPEGAHQHGRPVEVAAGGEVRLRPGHAA